MFSSFNSHTAHLIITVTSIVNFICHYCSPYVWYRFGYSSSCITKEFCCAFTNNFIFISIINGFAICRCFISSRSTASRLSFVSGGSHIILSLYRYLFNLLIVSIIILGSLNLCDISSNIGSNMLSPNSPAASIISSYTVSFFNSLHRADKTLLSCL